MKNDDNDDLTAVVFRLLWLSPFGGFVVVIACCLSTRLQPSKGTMLAFYTPHAVAAVVFDTSGWVAEYRAPGRSEWKIDLRTFIAEPLIVDRYEKTPTSDYEEDGGFAWRWWPFGVYSMPAPVSDQYSVTIRHWFVFFACGCTLLVVAQRRLRRRAQLQKNSPD